MGSHSNNNNNNNDKKKRETIWIGYITRAHMAMSFKFTRRTNWLISMQYYSYEREKAATTKEWKNRCNDEWNRAEKKFCKQSIKTIREWMIESVISYVLRPLTHSLTAFVHHWMAQSYMHTTHHLYSSFVLQIDLHCIALQCKRKLLWMKLLTVGYWQSIVYLPHLSALLLRWILSTYYIYLLILVYY